jgi:hypothetical protein
MLHCFTDNNLHASDVALLMDRISVEVELAVFQLNDFSANPTEFYRCRRTN